MRVFLARAGALIFTILTWVWAILIGVSNWIGRSTVIEDYNQLSERLPAIAALLLATPWWVPALLAGVLTMFLIWLSWPTVTTLPSHASNPGPTNATTPIVPEVGLTSAEALNRAVRIIDMNIDAGRAQLPAAWLFFGCVGFNGSDGPVKLVSASGRINVAGHELHDQIELHENDAGKEIERLDFFRFTLMVPLNDRMAGEIPGLLSADSISVGFQKARIAAIGSSGIEFELRMPSRHVHFQNDEFGRDPRFLHGLIANQSRS